MVAPPLINLWGQQWISPASLKESYSVSDSPSLSRSKSDTPGKAGGLINGVASKAIKVINLSVACGVVRLVNHAAAAHNAAPHAAGLAATPPSVRLTAR
jgi:hypothetical protein